MERFEYRVVRTPSMSTDYSGQEKAAETFAQTLMDDMNGLAIEGWQFVRNETMVESRRFRLWGRSKRSQDYMVYRRALASNDITSVEPVLLRPEQRAITPNIELLRDRIAKVMSKPTAVVVGIK